MNVSLLFVVILAWHCPVTAFCMSVTRSLNPIHRGGIKNTYMRPKIHVKNVVRGSEFNDSPDRFKDRGFISWVNRIGVSVLLSGMLLRSLATLEVIDHIYSSMTRWLFGIPVIFSSFGNIAALVLNFIFPARSKGYVKSVVLMNLLRESIDLMWIFSSMVTNTLGIKNYMSHTFVERDSLVVYSSIIQNVFWGLICSLYMKSRW